MSKLRAHKPAHTTNPRQKAAIQPPWWNKETQAAWTDKRTMVKLWQQEQSKPHPDLTIKAHAEEKTEVFKRVANEANDRQWKSFCDTLNRDTTLTHFWQFYRQMESCDANTSTPGLIDASGEVLKTSKEKGSALLQRFVQQRNQNNLDERKAVWKGLYRTLTEAGSNDDLITELEFTEALPELSKGTAPVPDRVKYSDIKNLLIDNKRKLFRLYDESVATGQVPEDWSHSYLKSIPNTGKDHSKLNGYCTLTMQNTTGNLMERIVARKLAQELERRNILPPNHGRYRAGKNRLGKSSQIRIRCLRRIPEEGTNSGRGGRSGRCIQQSAIQTADGNPCAIWRQVDAHKMARSSTPGKKDLPCDLETGSPRPNN